MNSLPLITAVQVAIATASALKALDKASVKMLAFERYVYLSDSAFESRKALAALLDQQPGDLALTGNTTWKQQLFFMPSSKESGCWQLTRFDNSGEPWGDTHYTKRITGINEYLRDVDLTTLCSQHGPLALPQLTAAAKAVLLQDTKVISSDGSPLVLYHGTQASFEEFQPNPRGIFFSEERVTAEPFSRIRKGDPVIKEVHLAINRPWTMISYSQDTPYIVQIDQSVATLKAKGFDGIHCPDDNVWIAFEPEQIFDAAVLDSDAQDDELTETSAPAPHG